MWGRTRRVTGLTYLHMDGHGRHSLLIRQRTTKSSDFGSLYDSMQLYEPLFLTNSGNPDRLERDESQRGHRDATPGHEASGRQRGGEREDYEDPELHT